MNETEVARVEPFNMMLWDWGGTGEIILEERKDSENHLSHGLVWPLGISGR